MMKIEMPYGVVEINSKEDAMYFIKTDAIIVNTQMKCGVVLVIKQVCVKKKKNK